MYSINIRQATIEDLVAIQTLNNKLFELEYANFDDTLKVGWPFEEIGREYFKNIIKNGAAVVAEINNQIIGYLAGSFKNKISHLNIVYLDL